MGGGFLKAVGSGCSGKFWLFPRGYPDFEEPRESKNNLPTKSKLLMYEDNYKLCEKLYYFKVKALGSLVSKCQYMFKGKSFFCIFRTKNRPLCASKVNRLADCSSSVDSSSMQMANASIGRRRRQQCILNFFGKKVERKCMNITSLLLFSSKWNSIRF